MSFVPCMFYFADDTLFYLVNTRLLLVILHSCSVFATRQRHQTVQDKSSIPILFLQIALHMYLIYIYTKHQLFSMYVSVKAKMQCANLDSTVESCQDDAVQKQDTIQHVTDLRLCKSS